MSLRGWRSRVTADLPRPFWFLVAGTFVNRIVVVWTIGEIGFNAVEPALLASIAPAHLRGRYNGLIGMAFGAASLLGPLAGTWLFGVSPGLLWLTCLVTCALSAAATLALGPAIGRRQRGIRESALDASLLADTV